MIFDHLNFYSSEEKETNRILKGKRIQFYLSLFILLLMYEKHNLNCLRELLSLLSYQVDVIKVDKINFLFCENLTVEIFPKTIEYHQEEKQSLCKNLAIVSDIAIVGPNFNFLSDSVWAEKRTRLLSNAKQSHSHGFYVELFTQKRSL